MVGTSPVAHFGSTVVQLAVEVSLPAQLPTVQVDVVVSQTWPVAQSEVAAQPAVQVDVVVLQYWPLLQSAFDVQPGSHDERVVSHT